VSYLKLDHLVGGYQRGVPVLNDYCLEVEKGELISLLGPSGCGKTTTLRMISGFLRPTSGKLILDGKDITAEQPNKRNIGLVFQSYALFPHLSVFRNVAFGLQMRHVARDEIAARVEKALAMTDLTGLESRLPSQLSGGQRQRVALSRAIVIEPSVLLLDEPLSNLDAKLRLQMRAELSRIQRALNITMIYVTHDQTEALSLSDRIVVMNRGNIDQIGVPEDIYQRPATPSVARFVGFDNQLEGRVRSINDQSVTVEIDGTPIVAKPHKLPGNLTAGSAVSLLFRPEDALLADREGENCLDASVLFGTFQGKSMQYLIKVADRDVAVVVAGPRRRADGDSVKLSLPAEGLIIEKKEQRL